VVWLSPPSRPLWHRAPLGTARRPIPSSSTPSPVPPCVTAYLLQVFVVSCCLVVLAPLVRLALSASSTIPNSSPIPCRHRRCLSPSPAGRGESRNWIRSTTKQADPVKNCRL